MAKKAQFPVQNAYPSIKEKSMPSPFPEDNTCVHVLKSYTHTAIIFRFDYITYQKENQILVITNLIKKAT